jgi:predicted phosphodiesterase
LERIAVLSDIHGNLQALEAVLERADALGCDGMVCLGDVVGYGARPAECLALVRHRGAACIQGNHDGAVTVPAEARDFNARARAAVDHSRACLAADDLVWLAGLPTCVTWPDGTVLAHGAPADRDRYLLSDSQLEFERADQERLHGPGLTFVGHTHLPLWCTAGGVEASPAGRRPVPGGARALVNPGSVGQPRDGDPRASFAVWDRTGGEVEFLRVVYDIEAARGEILAAGLPESLGDRLRLGR